MKFVVGRALLAAASVALLGGAAAQEVDNIDGTHAVHAGDHYADCTGLFCFSGPNWGNNGQFAWYNRVTFSESAASYGGTSCFANTVEFYDWNKLWGKARCGYSHPHQQDSDRFVWRRLQELHAPAPNCGGWANCTGIQIATYSYDGGTNPYPNENWALSKTFATILQPGVPYVLGMASSADGSVAHTLHDNDGTLLETKINYHSNLCTNYEQGSVLGLYFGGTCAAPEDVSVTYEAVDGPAPGTEGPTGSPTPGPSRAPTEIPSPTVAPTPPPTTAPATPAPTTPPTRGPTASPTAPGTPPPTSAPTVAPALKYRCEKNNVVLSDDDICATGADVDDATCRAEDVGLDASCGGGGRKCRIATCAMAGPPPPGPGPAPSPPTDSPPTDSPPTDPPPPSPSPPTQCPVCGDGTACCPAEGRCQTSGPKRRRACV